MFDYGIFVFSYFECNFWSFLGFDFSWELEGDVKCEYVLSWFLEDLWIKCIFYNEWESMLKELIDFVL